MENLGYLYSVAIAAGGIVGYVKKGKEIFHCARGSRTLLVCVISDLPVPRLSLH